MDAAAEELCDRFASEFDRYGFSRTLGRVFGYLMIQAEPAPLQRIATDLGISRATASITMRHAVLASFALTFAIAAFYLPSAAFFVER